MRKFFFMLFLYSIFLVFSQENLNQVSKISLEEAILNRWEFYPDRVEDLKWNNKLDFYIDL